MGEKYILPVHGCGTVHRFLHGRNGMVFSILVMLMLSSLLLFMLSYLLFQSDERSTHTEAMDGWELRANVRDVQQDLARLSRTTVLRMADETVLANVTAVNYTPYITFMATTYRQKTFRNLTLAANDTFFADGLVIRHDRISFASADNLTIRLRMINDSNVTIDTYALSPGSFPLRVELYDQAGNLDVTVSDTIDPDLGQFFNLSSGLRVAIGARNLTISDSGEPYLLSVVLGAKVTVFFDAWLSLQQGMFRYDARVPYP